LTFSSKATKLDGMSDLYALAVHDTADDLLELARRDVPLRALSQCVKLRTQLARVEHQLVADARKRGATWAEIGRACGVTKQAASQKWGRTP
jgi:hypothetical protein